MIRRRYDSVFMQDPARSTGLEYLQVSGKGAYAASSVCGCNTRKYHGLFVVPQPQIDEEEHVLLSALEETLRLPDGEFRLGVHRYPGVYYPEGFQYISEFSAGATLKWTYQAGGCLLEKEVLLCRNENRLMMCYRLREAPGPVILQLLPLMASRNKHVLSHACEIQEGATGPVPSGVRVRMHTIYSPVFLQLSAGAAFFSKPVWYFNVEYPVEMENGYAFREDLYSPGFFEIRMCPGERITLSVSLEEEKPSALNTIFDRARHEQAPVNLGDCLDQARRHFLLCPGGEMIVRAGYYWFGPWGRDTCIALPGLTLLKGNISQFREVMRTMVSRVRNGLLPNAGIGEQAVYNTADASLWLISAVQQYAARCHAAAEVWREYGEVLKAILHHYKTGTSFGIRMDADGLIEARADGFALTWMDAVVDGVPVTPRAGKPVEINALWYNAVCFCLDAARQANDQSFVAAWQSWPAVIRQSFRKIYWDADKRYLADNVDGTDTDWSIRPNQVFAVSLPYSPLTFGMQECVLNMVRHHLLTPRGLRTLAPSDSRYCGHYRGDLRARDHAYHQGTAWPWLLGPFAEAYARVYKEAALPLLEAIYTGMEPAVEEYCLYSIAEVYDGDAPHKAGGAVSQAWSVAELLRLESIVGNLKRSYRRFQITALK